jgi:hypothetical protein
MYERPLWIGSMAGFGGEVSLSYWAVSLEMGALDGCEGGQFLVCHVYQMCTSLNGPKAEKLKLFVYMVGPGGLEPPTKGL